MTRKGTQKEGEMKEEQCLDEESFDYEICHRCQYEVNGIDCGEPAIAKGSWITKDKKIEWVIYLCNKHLQFILTNERR